MQTSHLLHRIGLRAVVVAGLAAAVVAAGTAAGAAATCTTSFDNDSDDSTWQNPLNWSGDTLPGPSDVACVPALDSPVVLSAGVHSIAALDSQASLTLSGGSLLLTDTTTPSTVAGTVTVAGGTLGGGADLTVDAPIVFEAGSVVGAGTLSTLGSHDVALRTSNAKVVNGRTLASADEVNWTGGSISLSSNAKIRAATALNADASTNLSMLATNGAGELVTPRLNQVGAGNTTVSAAFANTGSVNVARGSLELRGVAGQGTHTGSFTGPGRLTLSGRHHAFAPSTTMDIGALVFLQLGATTFPMDITVAQQLTFGSETSATFDGRVTAGTITSSFAAGGLHTFNGDVVVANTTTATLGATHVYNGDVTAATLTVWTNSKAQINGTARVNLAYLYEGTLTGSGAADAALTRLEAAVLDGIDVRSGDVQVVRGTTRLAGGTTVDATSVLTVSSPPSVPRGLSSDGGANKITARSLKYSLPLDVVLDVPIEVDGPVDVTGSHLSLPAGSGGGSHSGSWQVADGSVLTLGGVHDFVDDARIQSGTLHLAGGDVAVPRVTDVSNFTMDAASAVTVDIDGPAAAVDHDRITVGDAASITGRLSVATDAAYVPVDGVAHDVVVGPTIAGSFSSAAGLTGLPWGEWQLSYEPDAVRLTASTTPPTTFSAEVLEPINADGTSTFKANRGAVPVKFALIDTGDPTCNLPTATMRIARVGEAGGGMVNESIYESGSDSGSTFRITGCRYHYNVKASNLGVGAYLVEVVIDGQTVGLANFSLN